MLSVVLDGKEIETMEEIHEKFAKTFDFPEYYGKNLDALSDCLEDINDDICVVIKNKKELDEILENKEEGFYQVMQDVYENNPYFDLIIEREENGHDGKEE